MAELEFLFEDQHLISYFLEQADLNLYYVHQFLADMLNKKGDSFVLCVVEEGHSQMKIHFFLDQAEHTSAQQLVLHESCLQLIYFV